jgi:hypothetical protein
MSATEELTPIVAPVRSFPARHRWTVREFQRMGKTGFLDPKARLELIEGELFESPISFCCARVLTTSSRNIPTPGMCCC